MTSPITGIDHCIIAVRDLDNARLRMEHLGFAPTPRGVHSEHMGTHNHCVMLQRGYFEILGIRAPTDLNAPRRAFIADGEGLMAVALQTDDALAAREFLSAAGANMPDIVEFSRPVEMAGRAEARFTTMALPPETMPVDMFLCQHHTPDLVWQDRYLTHPNGVSGVAGVVLVAPDPGGLADLLELVFGVDRMTSPDGSLMVEADAGTFIVTTDDDFGARYRGVPGLRPGTPPYIGALILEADDPGTTRSYLDSRSVILHANGAGTLCIAPEDACGALLEIVAAG